MQVMLMRLMSKGEYLIVPKGTKFTGSGKLGLTVSLCFVLFILFLPTGLKARKGTKHKKTLTR